MHRHAGPSRSGDPSPEPACRHPLLVCVKDRCRARSAPPSLARESRDAMFSGSSMGPPLEC